MSFLSVSMKRVSVLAVVIGAAIDVIVSVLATMPFSFMAMFRMALANPSVKFTTGLVLAAVHSSPLLYGGAVLCVLACSLLAGAVAASLAKHDQVLNGAMSSFITVLLNAYHLVSGTRSNTVWITALMLLASPGIGALGGYLILRRCRYGLATPSSGDGLPSDRISPSQRTNE